MIARVGISRSQIYRMVQMGTFPAPVRIATSVSVWPDAHIAEWQKSVLEKAGYSFPPDSTTS